MARKNKQRPASENGEAAPGVTPGAQAPDPAACNSPEPTAAKTADEQPQESPRVFIEDCRRRKIQSTDWLADIPGGCADSEYVEVQFKNTRRGYYRNTTNLLLEKGDLVAVEAVPGHDIGTVTLTGALAELRMLHSLGRTGTPSTLRRVFRKAKPADV